MFLKKSKIEAAHLKSLNLTATSLTSQYHSKLHNFTHLTLLAIAILKGKLMKILLLIGIDLQGFLKGQALCGSKHCL